MRKKTLINWFVTVLIGVMLLIITLMYTSCNISYIEYTDINDYKGSVILGMEKDTAVTTIMYEVDLYTKEGKYKTITLRQRVAERYKSGDTIK